MIKLTSNTEGDQVLIFADIFHPDDSSSVARTALPATFAVRRLFTRDRGEPVLNVSVKEARRFAHEILRDTKPEEVKDDTK